MREWTRIGLWVSLSVLTLMITSGLVACGSGAAQTGGPVATPDPGRDVVKAVRFDEYRTTCFYMGPARVDWPVAIDCVRD